MGKLRRQNESDDGIVLLFGRYPAQVENNVASPSQPHPSHALPTCGNRLARHFRRGKRSPAGAISHGDFWRGLTAIVTFHGEMSQFSQRPCRHGREQVHLFGQWLIQKKTFLGREMNQFPTGRKRLPATKPRSLVPQSAALRRHCPEIPINAGLRHHPSPRRSQGHGEED